MPTVLERFGRAVRDLRKARGLTQEHLGEASGLTPMHISVIERGRKNPSLESIVKLAGALGLQPGRLMDAAFQTSDKKEDKFFVVVRSRLHEFIEQIEKQKSQRKVELAQTQVMADSLLNALSGLRLLEKEKLTK